MKLKITHLILIFSFSCIAQNSQEYIDKVAAEVKTENIGKVVINGFDEFTGDHNIQVNAMQYKTWSGSDVIVKNILTDPIFLSVHQRKNKLNTKNWIILQIGWGKEPLGYYGAYQNPSYCVSDQTGKIIFILDNGDKVNLNQVSNVECGKQVKPQYSFAREDLEKLCNNNIEKFRIYYTEHYTDYIVKDKRKDLLMSTFNVFKTEIDKFMQ